MGRSRGGLTTKIHAVVDANGNAVSLKLTEGQAHDGRSAVDMLDTVAGGQILLADRAYDSDALRAARGAWANIKPMPRRVNVPAFSSWLYRYATWSSASSASLSTPVQSLHALRSTTPTTLPSSNLLPHESGCGL